MTRRNRGSAHALYIDLVRCAGLFVAGLFAIFQLYSMCLKTGYFGVRSALACVVASCRRQSARAQDKGIAVLVACIGLVAIVPFKMMVCANWQHRQRAS
jgi:hypothetical protein